MVGLVLVWVAVRMLVRETATWGRGQAKTVTGSIESMRTRRCLQCLQFDVRLRHMVTVHDGEGEADQVRHICLTWVVPLRSS